MVRRSADLQEPHPIKGYKTHLHYVLVTPARNEAAFIEQTIRSVVSQKARPLKWVIVSDGSTDATDEIVTKYLAEHDWMQLISLPDRLERHFAGKVGAFNQGYEWLKHVPYDIIGNLDADISIDDEDYFSFLLNRFAENPRLGVGGTPFREMGQQYDYRFVSIEHVSGACQLFRRECFEAVGGYKPIKGGGVDWVAVTTARMLGWTTRTYLEKVCFHHRAIGTGGGKKLDAYFRFGRQDYYLGGHPLWEIFRSIYQMKNRPYVLGGISLLAGYSWAGLTGVEKVVSKDLETFRRQEQLSRLKKLTHRVRSLFTFSQPPAHKHF